MLVAQENNPANYTQDQIELLKRTVCKGLTDDELSLFLNIAKKTGLDVFSKQIHAVKRWDTNANQHVMTVQVGIDGYRSIAERTGAYAGSSEPIFVIDERNKLPISATITARKVVQGHICEFTSTVYWSEVAPSGKQAFMWTKMPRLMLAKVAEAQALRKAFPLQLNSIYTPEEMQRMEDDEENALEKNKKIEEIKNSDPKIKEEIINNILSLSTEINKDKTANEKAKFLIDKLKVSSFKDLNKKTEGELAAIFDEIKKIPIVAAYTSQDIEF